ncbi:hypothetical protein DM01DRAFT_1383033 [Hesseltinella vesiculosa]|uniref:GATA-type domain-containing protein n=1 Tax=Hesseltinella vesiculosa TaxID=101127 RepID=A0A1X2GJG8_9FUNG|nr:hypothetical protein DM01DRAFT_1383033 [Hesseltinella vesiculosa]
MTCSSSPTYRPIAASTHTKQASLCPSDYMILSPPELMHDDEDDDMGHRQPIPASPPPTPPTTTSPLHLTLDRQRRKPIPQQSPLAARSRERVFQWSPLAPARLSRRSISYMIQQQQQLVEKHDQPRIIHLSRREKPHRASWPRTASDPAYSRASSTYLKAAPANMDDDQIMQMHDQKRAEPLLDRWTPPPSMIMDASPSPSSSAVSSSPPRSHNPSPILSPLALYSQPESSSTQDTFPIHTFTSSRSLRSKGPCQACQESSEACMRKAFHWPFASDDIFYDKGRPFVYLCNKCGLRYNKSGGCVCRHCRWVLCKEEKRKALQFIAEMRMSRPNGYIDLDEEIPAFACTPKYWHCGHPWKVNWIVSSQEELYSLLM